ncbi:hypothetical protein IFM89_014623 [Coptis chinensis]|uniref:Pectinesterase inhibitor domain-containing protein n=1 Tax=Coptis chinensis TaxID=261450 RepID=A0A835ISE3_9MAGN|nr:hypothetical protein IFM89_014623 [Coptis chinensis]
MGRVLAAGISIIFVVGVIVGIVVTVNRGIGNTSHQTTFQAAQEEVTKAWGKSGALGKDTTTSFDKMLLDGCSELLLFATHRLQATTSVVEHSDFDTMSDRVNDLKTWSSVVIALKTTCLDDLLEKPGLQKTMQDDLMNATQITFNALAIVDEISQILSKVNSTEFPVKINQNSMRLLNAEVDKDGYPAWFSAVDRRFLALKKTHLTPNVVVAKDGSGQFETITEAISTYPKNNEGRFIIYVKVGQYHEKVTIPETAINIFIYGDAWS